MIYSTIYGKYDSTEEEKVKNDLTISNDGYIEDFSYLGDEIPKDLYDFISGERTIKFQKAFREERDKELAKVDIEINIALDNGIDTIDLRSYRQELRDCTATWTKVWENV
jgi:hypothetical protein